MEEHQQAVLTRRSELRKSLPDEIDDDGDDAVVITIALRFADGRTGQRRFASDSSLRDVFNWVDAMFELERETVILQTMNGKQAFEWDDKGDGDNNMPTLEEAGLGKKVGLRVIEKKVSSPVNKEKQKS